MCVPACTISLGRGLLRPCRFPIVVFAVMVSGGRALQQVSDVIDFKLPPGSFAVCILIGCRTLGALSIELCSCLLD